MKVSRTWSVLSEASLSAAGSNGGRAPATRPGQATSRIWGCGSLCAGGVSELCANALLLKAMP